MIEVNFDESLKRGKLSRSTQVLWRMRLLFEDEKSKQEKHSATSPLRSGNSELKMLSSINHANVMVKAKITALKVPDSETTAAE
jgi:hypothetical protein